MGWLGDSLKVIFGMDQEQRAWRDAVASAERRLRWGIQGGTAGDFEHALASLAACRDETAPTPHYLYRRERVAVESHLWLAKLTIARLGEEVAKIESHFQAVEEGRRSLFTQIEAARVRVTQMEADGSLISAREERRRLEEMEREAHDLPDLSAEKRARLALVLSSTAPKAQGHRELAAARLAALRALNGLDPEDQAYRDKYAAQFEKSLAAQEEGWKAVSRELSPGDQPAPGPVGAPPPKNPPPKPRGA